MSHAGRYEGRDRDSTACPYYAKVMGEEREREGGPGAAYPKEDLAGRSSVRVEAVLPSPRAKARPLPRDWGGVAGQGRGSNAGGGCGLWPSPSAAPLPSALSCSGRDAAADGPYPQRVPGLIMSRRWFQLAAGVGDTEHWHRQLGKGPWGCQDGRTSPHSRRGARCPALI